MINAQGFYTLIERVFLVHCRQSRHLEIEFQRNAVRVQHTQGAPLKRAFNPFGGHPLGAEMRRCLVNIVFGIDAERQIAAARITALAKDQTMMTAFFHRAKTDHLAVLRADLQAKCINIKGAAGRKIGDH